MSLINKANVRKRILDRCKSHRPGWDCKQVSAKIYAELELHIDDRINRMVHQHPTVGKTFKEAR